MADFMPQATIQQELESRVTQMQEGEDDVDIPAMDTTIPMGQQAYMTRDRAYMLNPQVNLSLAVRTYCSQNLMLLNHDDGLLIFRSMGHEPAKCEGVSSRTWRKIRQHPARTSLSDHALGPAGSARLRWL